MSIAKQDQFLAKGYGVADVTEGTPMTEDTVMCIGSATKAFTSALLAVLITEDNKNGGTQVSIFLYPMVQSHKLFKDIFITDEISFKN